MKTITMSSQTRANKSLPFAIILTAIIGLVLIFGISLARPQKAAADLPAPISLKTLEQQYGLRVNLVAVTAAGGMVDLRIKIVDAAKAKTLLQDKNNFPALRTDKGLVLTADKDTQSQGIKVEDNGDIFLLFSNRGNVVKQGSPVTVVFGSVSTEAIPAR